MSRWQQGPWERGLAAAARAGMEKLAGQDEYIGAPFQYVTITKAGITRA